MKEQAPTGQQEERESYGALFRVGVVVGSAVMAYGVWGALDESRATRPRSFAIWVVGADIVHDLLIAPLVCAVGFVLARYLREPLRTPVRSGFLISAIVILVGWPSLRGYGRDRVPDNVTVQPLDYTTAVGSVLVAVWIGVAVWAVLRWARQRPSSTNASASASSPRHDRDLA